MKNIYLQHKKKKIPLIVHTRSAEKETLEVLKKYKAKKDFKILFIVLLDQRNFAFKLLDIGAFISASGVVTFKKSEDLSQYF